jgi:threonine dehydrogenase-like Zn-dependent dehydrogenase
MKAIAVHPGTPDSVHLAELEKPSLTDIADGRGVLVQVLQVGVDGTDKEINAAEYGNPPPGYDFLVIGHEGFGRVVEVGPDVTELAVGDLVSPTVRRPGKSIYDLIGTYDMTIDDTYYERGINLLHGYLTEYFVDSPEYLVSVPAGLAHVGVLMEPMSIVEKGIVQTYEIQRRLRVWRPRRAAVLGAGAIGQLATLVLRLKGFEVVTMARSPQPNPKADSIERLGATFLSTMEDTLEQVTAQHGPFDIVFEATGSSRMAFSAMEMLAKNGVLILTSITGGHETVEIPADKINLDFVLNNKVMFGTVNANREYFELGVKDFAHAETQYPGWLASLLTHPIDGLENYEEMMRLLMTEKTAIKVYVNVSSA